MKEISMNAVNISISPEILWTGFGILFFITTVLSIVLLYHWVSYGYKPIKTGFAGSIYFMGTIVLVGVIFFAIISYLGSL